MRELGRGTWPAFLHVSSEPFAPDLAWAPRFAAILARLGLADGGGGSR